MHQCNSDGHSASRRHFLTSMGAAGAVAATACMSHRGLASTLIPPKDGFIDVHHHILPPRYLKANLRSLMSQTSLLPASTYTSWTPQIALEKLDKANIRTAIVSIGSAVVPEGVKDSPIAVARECNEFGAQMARDFPGRFGMFAALPLPDVEASLKEIAYAVDVLKLDGFGLVTSYGGKPVGHPDFAPVFDEINRRKLPVYIHVVSSCCAMPIEGIDPPTIDFPTDTTRAITSLAFGGTFARCPNINFIFAHGGGTLPSIMYRYGAPMKNFPPEVIKQRLPEGFAAMIRKQHFDISGIIRSKGGMASVLDMAPSSQLMYGSDVPFGNPNTAEVERLGQMGLGLTDADLKAIGRGNAARLFPRFA